MFIIVMIFIIFIIFIILIISIIFTIFIIFIIFITFKIFIIRRAFGPRRVGSWNEVSVNRSNISNIAHSLCFFTS